MNRKTKLLLLLVVIMISVYGIYYNFKKDKINYVVLGDTLSVGINPYGEISYGYTDYLIDNLKNNNKIINVKKYAKKDYTIEDILLHIETNSNLKKDLRESDLVTISIGANDFISEVDLKNISKDNLLELKDTIDIIIPNIENCIKEIRKYAKEDLIIVGYYNPVPFLFNTSSKDLDVLFAYIDNEYEKIAKENDCIYVPLYQLFKNNSNYLPNPNSIYPNYKGYKEIADKIFLSLK